MKKALLVRPSAPVPPSGPVPPFDEKIAKPIDGERVLRRIKTRQDATPHGWGPDHAISAYQDAIRIVREEMERSEKDG